MFYAKSKQGDALQLFVTLEFRISHMRQGAYFEIEFDNGDDQRKTIRFENERGVEALAKENLSPGVELQIACLGECVD